MLMFGADRSVIGVAVRELFEAADAGRRPEWLTDGTLALLLAAVERSRPRRGWFAVLQAIRLPLLLAPLVLTWISLAEALDVYQTSSPAVPFFEAWAEGLGTTFFGIDNTIQALATEISTVVALFVILTLAGEYIDRRIEYRHERAIAEVLGAALRVMREGTGPPPFYVPAGPPASHVPADPDRGILAQELRSIRRQIQSIAPSRSGDPLGLSAAAVVDLPRRVDNVARIVDELNNRLAELRVENAPLIFDEANRNDEKRESR